VSEAEYEPLPAWAVRILTVFLKDWLEEQGGSVEVVNAARYFGVSEEDIARAIRRTGALEVDGRGNIVFSGKTEGHA
jgi:hypothetical protein